MLRKRRVRRFGKSRCRFSCAEAARHQSSHGRSGSGESGFRILRQGKHVVMTNGVRRLTIPRHNPVNAITMGGIVRDAGLTIDEFRKFLQLELKAADRRTPSSLPGPKPQRNANYGSVGEEATPQKRTTPSPLVEPDVQISRIRLSQKLSPQAFAGSRAAERRSGTQPKRWKCAPSRIPSGVRKGRWLRRRRCCRSRISTNWLICSKARLGYPNWK